MEEGYGVPIDKGTVTLELLLTTSHFDEATVLVDVEEVSEKYCQFTRNGDKYRVNLNDCSVKIEAGQKGVFREVDRACRIDDFDLPQR